MIHNAAAIRGVVARILTTDPNASVASLQEQVNEFNRSKLKWMQLQLVPLFEKFKEKFKARDNPPRRGLLELYKKILMDWAAQTKVVDLLWKPKI